MRDSGGEAASLREAPLPQTPTPEEWLGIELVAPSYRSPPVSWARIPAGWLGSRRLTEPPRPADVGCRPIIGKGRAKVSKGRSQSPLVAPEGAKFHPRNGRGGSVSRRDLNPVYRRLPQLSGGTTYAEAFNPNASRSSGGSAREGKTAIAASGG